MTRRHMFLAALLLTCLPRVAADGGIGSTWRPGPPGRLEAFGRLPLTFEENRGQTDASVRFVARGPDYTVLLGAADATVRLPRGAGSVRMTLVGGASAPRVAAVDRQAAVSHYLLGNDPAAWRANVPQFASVRYAQVYDGIDLIYYGNQRQLEHDFVLAPAADPRRIALEFAGARGVDVTPDGDLLVHVAAAAVRFHKPVAYQGDGAARTAVDARYEVDDQQHVRFALGGYDRSRPLVIDPVLSYSTYAGGAGTEDAYGIAVDGSGSAYITGTTDSLAFPTTPGAFSPTFSGGSLGRTGGDVFVLKLDATGALVYSTFIGGRDSDTAYAIAVDQSGNAYLTGSTLSSNYPTTAGSLQPHIGNVPFSSNGDMFVTKLNAAGSGLVYSTYMGGESLTVGYGIAVDAGGNAYIAGYAWWFFRTPNPLVSQKTINFADAFVAKLNPAGSALIYATLLGGKDLEEAYAIAVDGPGNAYVVGHTRSPDFPTQSAAQPTYGGEGDSFVAKLNVAGAMVYSTFLGGKSEEEAGGGIAVDLAGNAYVTGSTGSSNFPVTAGALQTTIRPFYNAFVTKVSPSGSFAYSTFLGGALGAHGHGIAVDPSGNAFVIGTTQSSDFPTRAPIQAAIGSAGGHDLFLTELNPAGSATVFSTFLGGTGKEEGYAVALDASRNVYVAGRTQSTDFPTRAPFQAANRGGSDMFIAKIRTVLPTVTIDKSSLTFSAVTSGAALLSKTSAQAIRITQTGAGTVTWTAASTSPWLLVSPTSGTGSGTITASVQFATGLTATQAGTITLTLTDAANTVVPIKLTLSVVPSTAAPSLPFGVLDTPAGDASVLSGSVAVTGWTLDNIGVQRVELWRDLQTGETTAPFASTPSDPRTGKVFIANATFVDGARPDIETLFPTTPFAPRAGWGYLMLTPGLWNQGNGTYALYAFAFDQENNVASIGKKTIVVNNGAATRPFGSIDTPAIGGEASGPNFGWGLTPKVNGVATCKIQPSGVQVSIDSGPLQPVVFGDARTDIAGAFTGFSNTAAAGGHFIFDWSTLTNGPHTIGWLITDDCNRADGVGSRFFNVTTGTNVLAAPDFRQDGAFRLKAEATDRDSGEAVLVARGYGELPTLVEPDLAGSRTIEVKQGERVELRLPRGFYRAHQLGGVAQERALPIGSSWDAAAGIFYWQPAPGFLGPFRLVFSSGTVRIGVRVVVTP